jgi:ribonuclease Z
MESNKGKGEKRMAIRKTLIMLCSGVALLSFLLPVTGEAQALKVTLLGTGTPRPVMDRFGPATLVQADKETFLFDCGRGAAQRLYQLKIPLGQVPNVFLTHLHSDHVNGIPDFWLTGWLALDYANRKTPLQVWGPAGTKEMMSNLEKAFQADRHIRTEDEKLSPEAFRIIAQDIKEGVVFEKNGVKITAFLVDHFPGEDPEPCFGYRIDYAGRSVVISGDTRYSENLITFSKGVDVLIHEVAGAKEELLKTSVAVQRIIDHHVSPEEAGKIFSQVKPKLAVYTHFVMVASKEISPPTVQDFITMTRKTYSGPLEAGEDLMVIEVGDTVKVTRPSR